MKFELPIQLAMVDELLSMFPVAWLLMLCRVCTVVELTIRPLRTVIQLWCVQCLDHSMAFTVMFVACY